MVRFTGTASAALDFFVDIAERWSGIDERAGKVTVRLPGCREMLDRMLDDCLTKPA
jgi:hypothetical protein